MAGSSVTLRIGMDGAQQVRSELATLGPAGESAMRQITAASAEASGALRALDAGVQLGKEHIHALAEESGSFGKVLAEIGPVGLAAAAGLGIAAIAAEKLFEQTKQAGEFVEGIEKTAKTVGVSTDALQEYHHAAGQFGIDNEAADKALQSLNNSIGRMQTGVRDTQAKKIFAQLGLTRADFADVQNAADFLPTLADRIDQLDSEAKRVQIAKSLGVEELLPMLEAGSSSINRLRQDAHDLGIVISEDLITKTSAANREMKQASEIIKTELTTAFAPLMGVIAHATTDLAGWIKQLEGWIDKVREAIKAGHDAKHVADERGDGAGGLSSNQGYQAEIDRLSAARAQAVAANNPRGIGIADQGLAKLRQEMATADARRDKRLQELAADITRLQGAQTAARQGRNVRGEEIAVAGLKADQDERAGLLAQRQANAHPAPPPPPAPAVEGGKVGENRGPRAADTVSLGEDDEDRRAASEANRKAQEAARKAAELARQAQELSQRQDNATDAALKKADEDLLKAKHEALKSEQNKATAAQDEYNAQVAQIVQERADRDKELHGVDDQGRAKYRPQEIAAIEAAEDQVRQQKLANAAAERDKALADAKENQDKALASLNQNLLQSQEGLARTTEERRQLALQLLEMARADEWAERQAQLRKTPNVTQADIDAQKVLFDQGTVLQRQAAERANMSPLQSYRDNIEIQGGAGRQDFAQSQAVEELGKLDDALVQVETGAESVGKALQGIGQSVEQQLLHDLNQQFIVAPLSKTIEGFIHNIFPATGDTSTATALQSLAQSALQASQYLASLAANGGVPGASGLLSSLGSIMPSSATDGVSFDSLQAAGQWVDFGAATGGLISGPGTGTSDSIPARLSDGEYVVRAEATRQHLPLLHAINSGAVSGYADGGYVGDASAWRRLHRSPAGDDVSGSGRTDDAGGGSGDVHIHNHGPVPMKATKSKNGDGSARFDLVPLRDKMINGSAADGTLYRAMKRMPQPLKTRG